MNEQSSIFKENRKTLFLTLFYITLITSIIAIPFYIFTAFSSYEMYLNRYDGCGWNLFGGNSLCEIIQKHGPDKVHLANMKAALYLIGVNLLDIIGIIMLKMNYRKGMIPYTISLLLSFVSYAIVSKYTGMVNLLFIPTLIGYYLLVKSCLIPIEEK